MRLGSVQMLVKLQRPQPETSIFKPHFGPCSKTKTRRPLRPAYIAQSKPLAPPPTITMSQRGPLTNLTTQDRNQLAMAPLAPKQPRADQADESPIQLKPAIQTRALTRPVCGSVLAAALH